MNFGVTAKRRIIKHGKIFLDRATSRSWRQTRSSLDAGAVTGVGLDQTGIDGKAFAADQTLVEAGLQDGLEQAPQQIALAKAAMRVLRESGAVRHRAVETQAAEPSVGEVQMNLFAQTHLVLRGA